MYDFWDVVLLNFSPSKWMEINKIRPAIICSNSIINTNSPFVIVSPVTSNVENILFTHLFLENDFLEKKSKAIFEQLKSIDKTRIIKKIWSLNLSQIKDAKEKMKFCFDL